MKQRNQTQHRLHLIIASIPIVLLIGSFILDLVNLPTATSEPSAPLGRFTFSLLGIGLIAMIVASLPGLVDYSVLEDPEPVRTTAWRHLAFNGLSFVAFAGSMLCRWNWPMRIGPVLVPIALSAFGTGFLVYASYLGYRIMSPSVSNPQDDMLTFDRMRESRGPVSPITNTPPGMVTDPQWKKAEADEQRWHMEPRVDADGKSM